MIYVVLVAGIKCFMVIKDVHHLRHAVSEQPAVTTVSLCLANLMIDSVK